jgi:hypothetical protein
MYKTIVSHVHLKDGNGLELFWDTRQEPGGTELWQGRNVPLQEKKLLAALTEGANI